VVRRLRLVIADNDLAALDLAVTDLTLEGHEVVATATDGDSAMAACLTARPDVVVLDHRMPPGPHGLDVAARLRVEAPGVGVVLHTNHQDRAVLEGAAALGVTYVPKGSLRHLRRAVLEAAGPDRPRRPG